MFDVSVSVLSSYSLFLHTACFVCAIGSFGKVFIVSFLLFNNCTGAIKSRYRFVAKTKIEMKLKI